MFCKMQTSGKFSISRCQRYISHPRFVKRGVEEALFIIGEIITRLLLDDRERIDIVLGHVEVDHGLAAAGGDVTQVKENLGEERLDQSGKTCLRELALTALASPSRAARSSRCGGTRGSSTG